MAERRWRFAAGVRGRRWPRLAAGVAVPIVLVGVACWWLTAPLEDHPSPGLRATAQASPPRATTPAAVAVRAPQWPEHHLEGLAAKQLLLDELLAAKRRIEGANSFTATFRKLERMKGKLQPEHTMFMKARVRPFAIYLKFLKPDAGKEVVYAEGRHENKLIGHYVGVARLLVPRLAVRPDHPIALAESRHPITEAGVAHLIRKLIVYRELDLIDDEAVTILDRVVDAEGRLRYRSIHTHPRRDPRRPFARTEVLYDPKTKLPVQISNYDWPLPGRTGALELAERYSYDDLKLGVELTDLDFDPANPSYAFHRF